jgi:OOP family OmpA-OmpF porin
MTKRFAVFVLSAFLVSISSLPAMTQVTCEARVRAFNAMIQPPQPLPSVIAAARAVLDDPASCTAAQRAGVARMTALSHIAPARDLTDRAAAIRILEAGARFARPWQLMGTLGQRLAPDHRSSAEAYMAALADVEELQPSARPPLETSLRLFRLANEHRALAPGFVPAPVLTRATVRSIVAEAVPIPIEFEFDSERMTQAGRQYVEELFQMLREQSWPRITLVGHTDPRGSDSHNLELSRRRAHAVLSDLVARGYPRERLQTEGHGRARPRVIEGAERYSQEQVWQLQRRVEARFD